MITLENIKQSLDRIASLLSSRKIKLTIISTTTSGTLKGGFSKACFISSGSATTMTINGTAITMVADRAYIFGGDKNDVVIDSIAYNANGDTLQILIEYGGTY